MTKLDEMWTALLSYQPQADAAGHGESWSRVCREKTADAADAAYVAADAAAAAYAADAAYAAAYAATEKWAQKAIDSVNKLKEKT